MNSVILTSHIVNKLRTMLLCLYNYGFVNLNEVNIGVNSTQLLSRSSAVRRPVTFLEVLGKYRDNVLADYQYQTYRPFADY